ncbi:Dolichol kinase EVAN [Vitis vinifera]|uniref:dolichol kinase n=1 Tax=Vitis vinifera TaxID=29760 RepID=A0A438C2U8_VITVI|nr:Dolichol kinase EVAN [Vitis vinifera]
MVSFCGGYTFVHPELCTKYVPHKSDYHFSLFLGEALLVTSGLVLYFGDMLGCTIAKIDGYWIPLDLQYGAKRSEISTIIQGVVLGLLLFPIFFKFLLQIWEHIASSGHSEARACNEIGKSVIFHTSLAFILIVIIPSWMQFVLDFHMHPLLWYLLPSCFILF